MSIRFTIASVILFKIISIEGAGQTLAQRKLFDFNHITGNNGIAIGKITGITQDKFGYMWFVDQNNRSLIRYDGYRMKAYKHSTTDKNSPGGHPGECIVTDLSGCIWYNHSTGIDKYDPVTRQFTHYPYPPELKFSGVGAMLVDHLGFVWIGTGDGLDRLDPGTGKFIRYANNVNDTSSISCNIIRSLYEDREGVLWIGTGWPFTIIFDQGACGGLNKFDRATGTFTRYMHDPNNSQSIINNKVRAIFEDSHGIFWVGTQGDGLHIMDREKGTFQRLTYDATHPEKLSRPPVKKGNEELDHITFITEDGAGAIWIGTYTEGLIRYEPGTKEITRYRGETARLNGFADSSGWCAYKSREGVIWIATESLNLFCVDPLQTNISQVNLDNNGARCFYEDKKGTLWVGLWGDGLARVDQTNSGLPAVKIFPLPVTGHRFKWVNYISPSAGKLRLATWYGIFSFDTETGAYSIEPYSHKKTGEKLISIFVGDYNDGKLYIAGRGFNVVDLSDSSMTEYFKNPRDSTSISGDTLITVLRDRSNNIWIGTRDQGLNLFDSRSKKFRHYLPGLSVYAIYCDTKGTLWVGTSSGLYLRDSVTQDFVPYIKGETEFSKTSIMSLIEDDAKNIWGASSIGLFRINREKNEFCLYGRRFGITQLHGNQKSDPLRSASGELIFGNFSGYYSLRPEQLINHTPPVLLLTGLNIDSRPVPDGENSFYTGSIENTERIKLRYNQNIFSIDFTAIHYSDPENNIIQYQLEGYENTWRNAGQDKTAYYFNIPPDHYIFRIKAASSYGILSERSIQIIISPPWWQTWWFRIAAIIFIGTLFYLIIRWRFKQKFKSQLERSEKEKEVAELKQKGTELEMQALRAQMNPHFIFNSLNSINRFILQNNKTQASEYLTKFSKLVRLILQNSQASLIPLESELESLELYLNLEALRFNYHFDYKIAVSKDLDISALQVPPLILQPYVENAIWHGLMHKEEKGQLDVEVSEGNDHLYFRITDNGIGREKAAVMASKSATKHKSMGLRITAHRIAVLQNSATLTSPVTINDLANADGSAAGTEVVIKMPMIYD